jgi:hypothetical protein
VVGLCPQSGAAILFKAIRDERVDDVMPGLQYRLVIRDRCFLLLGVAQFQRALQPATGEDR